MISWFCSEDPGDYTISNCSETTTRRSESSTVKRRDEKRRVPERILVRKSSRSKPSAERSEVQRRPAASPSRNSVSQTARVKSAVKAGFSSFPYRDKEVLMADIEFRN